VHRALRQLAASFGLSVSYRDTRGQLQVARPEALLAVLEALGVPIEQPEEAPALLRARQAAEWRQRCEPVTVAWEGEPATLRLRLPASPARTRFAACLELEDGSSRELHGDLREVPVSGQAEVDGHRYTVRTLSLPPNLPWGYHRLVLEFADSEPVSTTVIAAPRRAWMSRSASTGTWGTFVPLYAWSSQQSWGAGHIGDLAALLEWTRAAGGRFAGTLPLLATFLDEPYEISPYRPVSRLFWNEFYVQVTALPEFQRSEAARALVASPEFQAELHHLRNQRLVDYRAGMRLRRRVLAQLARECWETPSTRRDELEAWSATNPEAERYARFRATVEERQAGWRSWPEALHSSDLREADPTMTAYHLYVQWAAETQLTRLAGKGGLEGSGLYLDLPLGVHPDGFDTWRFRGLFLEGVSVGAPPDPFFADGQVWGFPPLHPERQREDGYAYFRACLRHHLCHAWMLRVDHVMGLHRLYLVPAGSSGRDGVYLHYPAEELYALLTLESHRCRCIVLGEDLGTVPGAVRRAMARHGLLRMYVLPFELRPGGGWTSPPRNALACLGTHDLPPFAALWQSWPPEERERLLARLRDAGYLPASGSADPSTALRGFLALLAASPALAVVINLEDLWLESEPQNRPGTGPEQPNWRRKARYGLEDVTSSGDMQALLAQVNWLRQRKVTP
jgi:4-alpha-glucanotransferase